MSIRSFVSKNHAASPSFYYRLIAVVKQHLEGMPPLCLCKLIAQMVRTSPDIVASCFSFDLSKNR